MSLTVSGSEISPAVQKSGYELYRSHSVVTFPLLVSVQIIPTNRNAGFIPIDQSGDRDGKQISLSPPTLYACLRTCMSPYRFLVLTSAD